MSRTIEAHRKNHCCWSWYLVNTAWGDGFIPSGGMNKEMQFVVALLYFLQWLMTYPLYFSLKKSPFSFCMWTFGPTVVYSQECKKPPHAWYNIDQMIIKAHFIFKTSGEDRQELGFLRRIGGIFALFSGYLSLTHEGPGRPSFATQTVNFTDTSCPPVCTVKRTIKKKQMQVFFVLLCMFENTFPKTKQKSFMKKMGILFMFFRLNEKVRVRSCVSTECLNKM